MYSQHLLRVQQDELLRCAESRRLIRQAAAAARQGDRAQRPVGPQRVVFSLLGVRRPVRHA